MRWIACCSILALFVVGCSSSDRTPPTMTVSDAGTTDPPPTNPDDVPPEPLGGDPSALCPGPYAAAAPSEGLNTSFQSAGQSRSFWLILPPPSFTGPRPIFVAFNGTGENGMSFSSRAELTEFAARGFIVAAPSSNMNGTVWPIWDDMRMAGNTGPNPDVQYFDELLACLGAHFEVDGNRIYVGGHSAGGIFTNAVLQRRSNVIAGGIVASGIFDLTSPPDLGALDPMFVIVTWGGPDDSYSGGVGVTVPEINFVEQASISSQFYENEPNVGQAHCSITGSPSGHYWLPINDWFVDRLLEHPKGIPGSQADLTVPPSPQVGIECTADPFVYDSGPGISCPPASTMAGCTDACQLLADCGAANDTVGGVIGPQLNMLGFSGSDLSNCGGCVTKCDGDATPGVDEAIFSCMRGYTSMCGPGIEGFQPAVDAINGCCDGRRDSGWCVETCRILLTNSLATSFFPTCTSL
jgi:predicted esterase